MTLQTTDATTSRERIDAVTTTITCAEITVEDAVVVSGYCYNTKPTNRGFIACRLLVKG